ncbi:baseplate J/gp47 family protein [Patescibacteria group bacterium]|nr:baseplate J/gp47 family protein [Patescibacteria group bacterium]MBU1951310.1 baseplate J/gp47 family protein [Patescibacteria group bacterium]
MSRIKKAKIEKYYSKVAFIFLGVALIAVVAIVYVSLAKTVITIKPSPEAVSTSFEIQVVSDEVQNQMSEIALSGRLAEKSIEETKNFTNVTSQHQVEGKAEGTVTIHNNYSSTQPLVATTRLLSEDDVLFRTKETVTVPAGGQVDVEVEADQPGEQGNIGPTRFTIVALWKGLQDKIYAESSTSMNSGLRDVTVATLQNINDAKEDLASELKEKAIGELSREIVKEHSEEKILNQAVTYQILDEEADIEPDTEVNSFEVTSSINIIAAVFDEDELFEHAKQLLAEQVPDNNELAGTELALLQYEIKSYDLEEQSAVLKVTLNGTTYVKLTSPIFKRDNLTNRDKQEIKTYFLNFSEIQNVDVKFSPFWVFRSPSLKDHIEIVIAK